MLAVLVSACATPQPSNPTWPVFTGRLAVQVAATPTEPARGFTGQFDLRGSSETGRLEVSGPLGAGGVRAQWKPGQVQLIRGDQVLEFNTLDQLAANALGESLPLAALFDWLKARPWPQASVQPLEQGQPGFFQLGWRIDTGDMAHGRLRAQRLSSPVIELRVVLDDLAAP
jgi:outer membrane lipoprotein LolB